ncbi:MAG: aspartyl/asparaginyl beta-hydroxylase domain-containing protein [Saprospiraceae bacterium]|nr:aspartyl/asparaginyl beta-hydroxylase domain-containing protein [Saprospiraceae bacterium]
MTKYTQKQLDAFPDRIKLPFTFDVEKLQNDISNMTLRDFIYYDVQVLRGPAHVIDPSIPFPPPADDYADGSWCDWKDNSLLEKSAYLKEVVDFFKKKTKVTLVRLLRLEQGSVVKEHTDPTLGIQIHKSVIRLTIPILTNDNVTFYLNKKPVEMELGECWYLKLTDPHSITNEGSTQRINMSIDMIPNEWVFSQIIGAVE